VEQQRKRASASAGKRGREHVQAQKSPHPFYVQSSAELMRDRTWLKPQLSHSQRVGADQKPSFSGLAAKQKTAPPVSVEEGAG
jgi:hypothetical protein